jgi:hypothetical protein
MVANHIHLAAIQGQDYNRWLDNANDNNNRLINKIYEQCKNKKITSFSPFW